MANVLIVAEQRDGKLRSPTYNAISFGKKMLAASAGTAEGGALGGRGNLLALIIGSNVKDAAAELARYGVSKVLCADNPAYGRYLAETYAPVVAAAAKAHQAAVVAATATAFGKDLMPRVAGELEAGMASDICDVAGPKTFKRPMVAGNLVATVEVQTPIAVVTARQTEFPAAQPEGQAAVESFEAGAPNALGAEVVKFEEVKSTRPDLSEAKVVVAGGRGMKTADNFKVLEQLTDIMGGALGATRAACDAGMVTNDLQVGQTGKIVAPDLYIAVGLSGAIQHLAGMKSSKVIVAINKDEEAPIFSVADYGLVAKWEDTLPAFVDKVKAIRASK
jgi:electron transfer flavoprotein alpha subunit